MPFAPAILCLANPIVLGMKKGGSTDRLSLIVGSQTCLAIAITRSLHNLVMIRDLGATIKCFVKVAQSKHEDGIGKPFLDLEVLPAEWCSHRRQ